MQLAITMLDKCTAETSMFRTSLLYCLGIKLLVKTKDSLSRSACIAFFAKILNVLAIFIPEISDYERRQSTDLRHQSISQSESTLRVTQFFADFIKTIKRSEFVFLAKVLEFCGVLYNI